MFTRLTVAWAVGTTMRVNSLSCSRETWRRRPPGSFEIDFSPANQAMSGASVRSCRRLEPSLRQAPASTERAGINYGANSSHEPARRRRGLPGHGLNCCAQGRSESQMQTLDVVVLLSCTDATRGASVLSLSRLGVAHVDVTSGWCRSCDGRDDSCSCWLVRPSTASFVRPSTEEWVRDIGLDVLRALHVLNVKRHEPHESFGPLGVTIRDCTTELGKAPQLQIRPILLSDGPHHCSCFQDRAESVDTGVGLKYERTSEVGVPQHGRRGPSRGLHLRFREVTFRRLHLDVRLAKATEHLDKVG
eukprot:tig00000663_g2978.t2